MFIFLKTLYPFLFIETYPSDAAYYQSLSLKKVHNQAHLSHLCSIMIAGWNWDSRAYSS